MMESNESNYALIIYRIDQLENTLKTYLDSANQERRDMVVRITRLEERQSFLERALGFAMVVGGGAAAGHIPQFF